MLANTVVALLSLAAGITALPSSTTKRQTTDNEIKLYAYGTGISGMEIYGGPDGMFVTKSLCRAPDYLTNTPTNDTGLAYISTAPTNENLTELICMFPMPFLSMTRRAKLLTDIAKPPQGLCQPSIRRGTPRLPTTPRPVLPQQPRNGLPSISWETRVPLLRRGLTGLTSLLLLVLL